MMFLQRIVLPFSFGAAAGGSLITIYERQKKSRKDDLLVNSESSSEIESALFKYGKPEPSVSLHTYKSHALAYDRSRKVPVWVMETLSKSQEKHADRKQSEFQPDPALPTEFTAVNSDYWKSGWSRGHMAAAGNYLHCQPSMNDTFYLTNIVPQNMENNENYWYRLEKYCKGLVQRYDKVTLISGPLFLPSEGEDKHKYVKHKVIGKGEVCVPTHLYKIVLVEKKDGSEPLLGTFVVPNQPIPDGPLTDFQVPIETVEKWTGTKFFQFLQKHKCLDLCEADGCKLMSMKEYLVVYYTRRIPNARTIEYLESLWAEMKTKGIEPDEVLTGAYEKRREELKKT